MENFDSKYQTFYALKREYKAYRMLKAPSWYIAQIAKQANTKNERTTD